MSNLPPISTKAPESDIQEDLQDEPLNTASSPVVFSPTVPSRKPLPPGAIRTSMEEASAPPAPTVSDHCVTDRPLSSATEPPSGAISTWNSTEVYISKPGDYPSSPARLLLLLTNGTGIRSRNNQHQADLFARQGYLVVMPDMFNKDPAPNSKPAETDQNPADASWLDTVKLKAAETAKSFMLDMWLARHTPEKVLPVLHAVIKQAREEYADAVSYGDGIFAVGYCFGGKYILTLAAEQPKSETTGQESKAEQGDIRKGPEIKCGICAHGTLVGMSDVRDFKAPLQIVAVEDDPLFPKEVLDAAQESLKKNGVDHEVEVYPGVPHGFAVVGDYESKAINDAQSRAFNGMVRWLNAH